MTYDILDLKLVTNDTNLYGGKAVTLSKLINNGLNIPHGFVLSSNIYRKYLEDHLDYGVLLKEICNWMDQIGITQDCIVRSSANVENVFGKDCPGIFESFLCNNKKDIINKIIQVWNSTTSQLAKKFFNNCDCSDNILMAVIVQCVQRGRYSAVIQSYDLVEDRNRIIVEYCEGTLNSIVDDEQNASIYYIERNINSDVTHSSLPIEKIKRDCITIETIIGGKAEIEAQITDNDIWYIQARKIS
ncbi:hypothetical protein J6Z19_10135 [bacterium]|nr:hypothetical protein [bacterium]